MVTLDNTSDGGGDDVDFALWLVLSDCKSGLCGFSFDLAAWLIWHGRFLASVGSRDCWWRGDGYYSTNHFVDFYFHRLRSNVVY